MRILEETIFRFFPQKTGKSPSDAQMPMPVDALAEGRDALAPTPNRLRSTKYEVNRRNSGQDSGKNGQTFPENGEERRKEDRRQRAQDVWLDTRTEPERRRPGDPAIDIEV